MLLVMYRGVRGMAFSFIGCSVPLGQTCISFLILDDRETPRPMDGRSREPIDTNWSVLVHLLVPLPSNRFFHRVILAF